MPTDAPPAVRSFFSGRNARDLSVALSGFSPSAVVRDEGGDHRGLPAIRSWIETSIAPYDDKADVRSASASDSGVEVLADVSGTFPGSPILLRFTFTMADDRIVGLKISS